MTEYSAEVMQLTAISFKLPESLREKIKARAALEERSESGFLRYHLAKICEMSDAETRELEMESEESAKD